MNFLSGWGAEEPTVYGWNTKVSAPFYRKYQGNKNLTVKVMTSPPPTFGIHVL